MVRTLALAGSAVLLALATPATAQIVPSKESLSHLYAGKVYSPYAQRGFPSRPMWGDTHLHTGLSVDAGLFGARLGLDEAYKFARGEEVVSSTGQPVKLARPLDFLVIADHSDGMGMVTDLAKASPNVTKFPQGERWSKGLRAGGQTAVDTALDLITNFAQGKIDPKMMATYSPGSSIYASVWKKVVDTAEAYNEPGRFTAMIGFEWTSLVKGNNLHRNVLFRDGAAKAGQVVPYTTPAAGRQHRPARSLQVADKLRSQDRRLGPGDRAQRQSVQRPDVSGRRAIYRPQARRDLRQRAQQMGAGLRGHPDQG